MRGSNGRCAVERQGITLSRTMRWSRKVHPAEEEWR